MSLGLSSKSLGPSSGTKNQPKEEVFGRISLRTSGQKLRSEPQILEKKQAFGHRHPARTSMKKLRSEKLRADFLFPTSTLEGQNQEGGVHPPQFPPRRFKRVPGSTADLGFGKRGLLENWSFQRSPFSRDSRELRDSRVSREPWDCGKQRRIRPFSRDSRESRHFRDSRHSVSEKTPFVMTPFSGSTADLFSLFCLKAWVPNVIEWLWLWLRCLSYRDYQCVLQLALGLAICSPFSGSLLHLLSTWLWDRPQSGHALTVDAHG